MAAPSLDEVRGWPATISVPKAATALGCSRSALYEAIKTGQAPVKTLSFGRRHVVITASLITVLEAS
ncbi:DNA-binding protein [Streptomyces sp. PA03-6a]|nr:DNA-binding protein [Streptomyces sp. PA03-6a]